MRIISIKKGLEYERIFKNKNSALKEIGELRTDLHRYISLFKNAPLGYQSLDEMGYLLDVNDSWLDILGYSREEVIGHHFTEFLAPEFDKHFYKKFPQFIKTGEIRNFELIMRRKDGSILFTSLDGNIVRDEYGNFKRTQCVLKDITDRKIAETKLHESEKKFRGIAESVPGIVMVYDIDTLRKRKLVYINQRLEELIGKKLSDEVGNSVDNFFNLIHEDDFRPLNEAADYAEANNKLLDYEFRIKSSSEEYKWMRCIFQVYEREPGIKRWLGIIIDISKQKEAEEELKEREERFRSIVENTEAGYFFIDKQGLYQYVNDSWLKMHKYDSPDEIIGQHFKNTQLPEHRELALEFVDGIMRGKPFYLKGEFSRLCKDGSIGYHSYSARPVKKGRKVIGIEGFIIDNTEHYLVEKAIKNAKKEWESTFDAIDDWIMLIDLNSNILRSNSSCEKIIGIPLYDIRGKNCCKIIHKNGRVSDCPLEAALKSGKRESSEFHLPEKDLWVSVSVDPIMNDEGEIVSAVHIVRDITSQKNAEIERKMLEEKIQQVQKLQSLSVLAGGVAHKYNNLLQSIIGNVSLLKLDLPTLSPFYENVDDIDKAAQSAAELTKQMLAYSGKGAFELKAFILSELIKSMTHLIETSVTDNCFLKFDLNYNIPLIEGDTRQIRQVLMNLVNNACEAIGKEKGIINITTGSMHCAKSFLERSFINENLPEGLYVYLEVNDSGCGMNEETLKNIFDPFFSTKFTGRGLGLAATLGIVRGHNGAIKSLQ